MKNLNWILIFIVILEAGVIIFLLSDAGKKQGNNRDSEFHQEMRRKDLSLEKMFLEKERIREQRDSIITANKTKQRIDSINRHYKKKDEEISKLTGPDIMLQFDSIFAREGITK
jgi:hypothetical protein